jgi:hypothetical protein
MMGERTAEIDAYLRSLTGSPADVDAFTQTQPTIIRMHSGEAGDPILRRVLSER